jgi:hypothetical protein
MSDLLQYAITLARDGYSVIPVKADGTKAPAVLWKPYTHTPATEQQVREWFAPGRHTGIGIITGAVSGGAELTELEGRAAGHLDELHDLAEASGLGDLWKQLIHGWFELSPGGGIHLLYRVDGTVPGNTKIARDEKGLVLAETRGEGGFVVIAPTPGTTTPPVNPGGASPVDPPPHPPSAPPNAKPSTSCSQPSTAPHTATNRPPPHSPVRGRPTADCPPATTTKPAPPGRTSSPPTAGPMSTPPAAPATGGAPTRPSASQPPPDTPTTATACTSSPPPPTSTPNAPTPSSVPTPSSTTVVTTPPPPRHSAPKASAANPPVPSMPTSATSSPPHQPRPGPPLSPHTRHRNRKARAWPW